MTGIAAHGLTGLRAAVRARVEDAVAGMTGIAPVNVIDSYLPPKRGTRYGGPPDPDTPASEPFPFALVRARNGTARYSNNRRTANIRIDLGVHNTDDQAGVEQLDQLIENITRALFRNPLLGGGYTFDQTDGLSWDIYDMQASPFIEGWIDAAFTYPMPTPNFDEVYYGGQQSSIPEAGESSGEIDI